MEGGLGGCYLDRVSSTYCEVLGLYEGIIGVAAVVAVAVVVVVLVGVLIVGGFWVRCLCSTEATKSTDSNWVCAFDVVVGHV